MKEQRKIPTGKVQRASRFVKTGAKVGRNYIKHYGRKLIDSETSREQLDLDNAEDIYDSLSKLKGSALKVAQMLSMDKNMLPTAFQEKFAMAQYSAPPLSFPLVVKTFRRYFNRGPEEIFDTFTKSAVNAASIGQVHEAHLDGKKLAVKIQYPGVRESISSDLKLVKPIAASMFKINMAEMEMFAGEVENKLYEETNYDLELERSLELTEACNHIENTVFPKYYPRFSSERILVMDWLDGVHLKDWLATNPSQEERNKIGQAMWDFYDFQIHELKKVHADPHPGNFIITDEGKLAVIDFGCVKEIPEDFYHQYFQLMRGEVFKPDFDIQSLFMDLGFLSERDTMDERSFYTESFVDMIELLGRPFRTETFDFGDPAYFEEIYSKGEKYSKMKEFRQSKTVRGNKDGIYINRTYFGLYSILSDLGANIRITQSGPWKKVSSVA